jgi:hypothetical protein
MSDPLAELTRGLFGTPGLSATTRGLLVAQPAHQRTRIRREIVRSLRAEVIEPSRVYDSLPLPLSYDRLPAIFVYTLDDSAQQLDRGPRVMRRTLQLKVDVVTAQPEGLEMEQVGELMALASDTLCHLVEQILEADRYLGGQASDLLYTGTQTEFEDAGEGVVMHSVVGFDVLFDVLTDGQVSGSLRTVHAGWDTFPPNDGVLEAEDEIELEEPA